MKDTLCSVVSVFFKTALFFLCGTAIGILSQGPGGGRPFADYAVSHISSHGAPVLLAALFLALVSAHFRIIRKPGKKPLSFALIFVSAFCILSGGLYALGQFFPAGEAATALTPPPEAGKITRAGRSFVWIDAGENPESRAGLTGPVVIIDRKNGAGNFRVYAGGSFDAEAGTFKLSPDGEELPLDGAGYEGAELPSFARFFMDAAAYIAETVSPKSLVDVRALCGIFSLVFFGFSLWAPAKLSRWPLFNVWFTLAAVWLVFSGARLINLYLVPELLRFPAIAWAAEYLPAAFPGFCGLVLFLAGILGKPLEEWRREMRYD